MSITQNRKAKRDFLFLETLEVGIELSGSEVKSIRNGECAIDGAFAKIEKEEIFLYGCHINPYSHSSTHLEYNPNRKRRLLGNKKEILKWHLLSTSKNYIIVCLDLHWKNQWVKANIALAKSKNQSDKREAMKKESEKREAEKSIKHFNQGK